MSVKYFLLIHGSLFTRVCLASVFLNVSVLFIAPTCIAQTALEGVYTIQQKSNGRYVDAYESRDKDYRLVTRTAQNNNSQRWILTPLGNDTYTIQQKSNRRYVDAHKVTSQDYRLVTRPAQNNDSQQWILTPLGNNTYTIQQKSNGRYVDAYEVTDNDYGLVTRPAQNNDSQKWIIRSVTTYNPQCAYSGIPPTAVSKRRALVRILTQNAFGLDKDGNANCRERGRALGNHIANASPGHDIVALQEHWEIFDAGISDCDPSHLSDALWSTGRYRNSNNYYRHRPRGEWSNLEVDGGLSIFTLHPIQNFSENEWDEIPRDGPFRVLHGSTFSRIKLLGSDLHLDVYNVHLLAEVADDCSPSCRREQLEELRAEIVSNSRSSGNPVIVMGDFNIGGPPSCAGNDSYHDIMQVLEHPRDLWLENHPNQNGYTADCERNSVLRDISNCSARERIDYIFAIESPNLTNSDYQVVMREPSDIRVAEIRRSNGGPVSDHFGVEATIEIRERGKEGTRFSGLSGKCMEVAGGESADGTPVHLFDCNGTASQSWTLGHDGQLRGLTGKCLTVSNGSTANRTPTELRTCTGAARQRFDFTAAGELRSRLNSNKCIEVQGGFSANRTPIQLFDCNGTASQRWHDDALVPELSFNPRSISFGAVPVGGSRWKLLKIKNTLGRNVTVSFLGSLSDPMLWRTFNETIANSETKVVYFEFRPTRQELITHV